MINKMSMKQLDQSEANIKVSESQLVEAKLQAMTHELENLQQNLIFQLSQDVKRLQKEKYHLIEVIEKQQEKRHQQIIQQQELIEQITPNLANQLQPILAVRLSEIGLAQKKAALSASEYQENAYRLIASLDSTLRGIFRTLQQDLNSYEIFLSQQFSQMYNRNKKRYF
jgi:excinuclease UvrABC ATPase subunit